MGTRSKRRKTKNTNLRTANFDLSTEVGREAAKQYRMAKYKQRKNITFAETVSHRQQRGEV